ncbi:hypothetical protein BC828DRAFT_18145, partial [Blastocladiella britannica]
AVLAAAGLPILNPAHLVALGHGRRLLPLFPLCVVEDDKIGVLTAAIARTDVPVLEWCAAHLRPCLPWELRNLWSDVGLSGSIAVLEWFETHQHLTDAADLSDRATEMARAAAGRGHLAFLQHMHAQHSYNVPPAEIMDAALLFGMANVCEWLVADIVPIATSDSGTSGLKDAIKAATLRGHANLLDLALKRAPDAVANLAHVELVVDCAFASGTLPVVQWWWDRYRASSPPAFAFGTSLGWERQARSMSLPVLEFLWSRHQEGLLQWGAPDGTLGPVDWSSIVPPTHVRVDTVAWWHARSLECGWDRPWALGLADCAATQRDVAAMEWAWDNVRPEVNFTEPTIAEMLFRHDDAAFFEFYWLHRADIPMPVPADLSYHLWMASRCSGTLVLAWWHEHHGIARSDLEAMLDNRGAHSLDAVSWWLRCQLAGDTFLLLLDAHVDQPALRQLGTCSMTLPLLIYWHALSVQHGLPFPMTATEAFLAATRSPQVLSCLAWCHAYFRPTKSQLADLAPEALLTAVLNRDSELPLDAWVRDLTQAGLHVVFPAHALTVITHDACFCRIYTLSDTHRVKAYIEDRRSEGGRAEWTLEYSNRFYQHGDVDLAPDL